MKYRINQLGYVIETLDNIEGVNRYILVCDSEDYSLCKEIFTPLCDKLYSNFVTYFTEDAVKDYLNSGRKSTTVFLSQVFGPSNFDIMQYRESFANQRVAIFGLTDVDTTDYHECAVGGGSR